jgi:hypothetical protein
LLGDDLTDVAFGDAAAAVRARRHEEWRVGRGDGVEMKAERDHRREQVEGRRDVDQSTLHGPRAEAAARRASRSSALNSPLKRCNADHIRQDGKDDDLDVLDGTAPAPEID